MRRIRTLRLELELDQETAIRLVEQAATERRPVMWQAEIMIRQALGLPFPYPPSEPGRQAETSRGSVRR